MEIGMSDYDKLMYEKLHNSDNYRLTFKNLTQEEKDKYFIFLESFIDRRNYMKSKGEQFVIDYIKNNGYLLCKLSDMSIQEMIEIISNKMSLLNILEYLPKSFISSQRFKLFIINKLETEELKMKFINKIIEKRLCGDIYPFILSLKDENKIQYLKYMNNSSQIEIIASFDDLELKKEYILKPEYKGARPYLVASTENEDFIIEMFNQINEVKFRINLINRIQDETLKSKLLKSLGYTTLTNFLDSFDNEENEIVELKDDIDPRITIGVELETSHKDIEILHILKQIPHGFVIHKDSSVRKGFEVVSPILHYTTEDISNLKHICTVLKQNGFYTNLTCGGHIHIGADYFETIDELKMLIHLYSNFEEIIYIICNKAYSIPRPSVNKFASKMRNQYAKAAKKGFFDKGYASLYEFEQKLAEFNETRYKGLNLQNLKPCGKNTIEFRMANGEIDFEELKHNIKL